MNKDEQLARLLRLKRHEKPPADYFDGFLDDFHAYQRRSLATQSAAALWWERFCTALSALRRPAVAWTTAGAYAAIMLLIYAWPAPDHAKQTTVVVAGPSQSPIAPAMPAQPPNQPMESFRPWQIAVPADQTITVGDTPGLKPPASGKRRTADQPQELPNVIGPAPALPKPKY